MATIKVNRPSAMTILEQSMVLPIAAKSIMREEKHERFKQDALKAWEEYQETGLHLTHEEVDAWLAKLEAGEDTEPPPCHT